MSAISHILLMAIRSGIFPTQFARICNTRLRFVFGHVFHDGDVPVCMRTFLITEKGTHSPVQKLGIQHDSTDCFIRIKCYIMTWDTSRLYDFYEFGLKTRRSLKMTIL